MSAEPEHLTRFRTTFHAERLALVREHGLEAFDQGQVLYVCARTGRKVAVRDQFYGVRPEGPIEQFIERLRTGWWTARQKLEPKDAEEGLDLRPVAALYAHYLPEVGFDWSLELGPEGPATCWRMDARGKVTRLRVPTDDAMFHDQLGAFADLRAGWRQVFDQWATTGEIALAEAQAGYLIGVRQGIPGDPNPADREDPALAHAFSRWDPKQYDTLEFLAGETAARYPFHGERFPEWLGEARTEAVRSGAVDLFVLADASEFLANVEDLCAHHGVAVEWIDPHGDLRVGLHRGPLRVEVGFAYPFLRTLHTGRTFVEGVRAFYLPVVEALDEAHDLLATVRSQVKGHRLDIEDGTVLVVRPEGADVPVGRWNLMGLVGRQSFRGTAGAAALLELIGYDAAAARFVERPVALDRCPVCGEPAQVNKVVRPKELLGVDPRTLAGVPIGEHVVYYTLDCPLHATPLEPGPGRGLGELETAYRAGLPDATLVLLDARELPEEAGGATLLVGFDVGSLVLEPARLKAALQKAEGPSASAVHVYAFFPDALVASKQKLEDRTLHQARLAALEAVQARFPARTWALDVARRVSLDVEPLGRVERAE